jgi:hypothetical protein
MEAAISCKFHCKRLAEHWRGYWPSADLGRNGRRQPGHTLDDTYPTPESRLEDLGRLVATLHRAGPPPASLVQPPGWTP